MRIIFSFILIAFLATPALAEAEYQRIKYKDWFLYISGEGVDRQCVIRTMPKSQSPKNVKRGEIYLSVAHRPAALTFYEISVAAGYPFSAISNPFAIIEKSVFKFFSGVQAQGGASTSAEESAWLTDLNDNKRMMQAMQKGVALTFKGTSARGTLVQDVYSLLGFTLALKRMDAACPPNIS